MITDWFFRVPAIRVAEARDASGAALTWMYRFDYPGPEANHELGACHGVEIPFVFDTAGQDDLAPPLGPEPSPGRGRPRAPRLGRLHHPVQPGLGPVRPGHPDHRAAHRRNSSPIDDPAGASARSGRASAETSRRYPCDEFVHEPCCSAPYWPPR